MTNPKKSWFMVNVELSWEILVMFIPIVVMMVAGVVLISLAKILVDVVS